MFIALVLLMSFYSVGAMFFAPALPIIANDFSLSPSMMQFFVSIYLLGVSFGQLIYGPLSNRFGRKQAVFVGIYLTMVGISIAIVASWFHWYGLLVFSRCLTGLGAAVGMVMNFTFIHDVYQHEQARKIIAYILMVSAIMPGIASTIGGYIIDTFDWHAVLYFLLVYCLIVLVICRRLSETSSCYDPDACKISHIFYGYRQQFSNGMLVRGALVMGGNTALIYVFSAISPFVMVNDQGLSSEKYGSLMLIPSIGLLLGSFLSARLVKIFKTSQVISLGLGCIFLSTCLLLIIFGLFSLTNGAIFALMFFMYMGIALCYSNVSTLTLKTSSNTPNGSAVISFINTTMTMVAVFIIQLFRLSNMIAMSILLVSIALFMITLYLMLLNKIKNLTINSNYHCNIRQRYNKI